MKKAHNVLKFGLKRLLLYFLCALAVIGAVWAAVIALNHVIGIPLPKTNADRFEQIGMFAAGTFGSIIFLTLVPLQAASANLSAGFFAHLFHSYKSQLALYILMVAALIGIFHQTLAHLPLWQAYSGELYLSLVLTCVLSIVLHHYWITQLLHQPWVVYQYVQQLNWEESAHHLWLELYECIYKAINGGRINDARYFCAILAQYYQEFEGSTRKLKEDIMGLYEGAERLTPLRRKMEELWPFLLAPAKK